MSLPRPPLKIPMPLDKAGYKVGVKFEVGSLPFGATHLNYFAGLRVMFAPGTDKVADALDSSSIAVRITLHRLENDREIKIPLYDSKVISGFDEFPRRYEVFELPEDKTTARMHCAEHSGAPRGTPDASAFVLSLTADKGSVTRGVYRFQVETLKDIPALHGMSSFFVYEEQSRC